MTQTHDNFPFGRHYFEMEKAVRLELVGKTDAELKNIIELAQSFTGTNCWWANYRIRDIVVTEAQFQLRSAVRSEKRGQIAELRRQADALEATL